MEIAGTVFELDPAPGRFRAVRRPIRCLIAVAARPRRLRRDGGTTRSDAEQVVRDFAKAVTESDGKTFCNELVTREYLEQTTGRHGRRRRVKQCEKQIDALQQGSFKIDKIDKTEINGDSATVTAQVETQGRRAPRCSG